MCVGHLTPPSARANWSQLIPAEHAYADEHVWCGPMEDEDWAIDVTM